ncbi:MAG: ATP-binding protein [Bacteroidia bacterium]|nr:ATP-binding protein [Bacteroidia bacterium]
MQHTATPVPYRLRRGKPVIVCVDDVKEILDTLEEQLSAHLGREYAFESALSGEEGLEVIEDLLKKGREVAVIISDVIMPGMKGDEFLIQAHRLSPRTLKIMLTGQESTLSQITNAINQAQLYRFISKPWDILDMQRTIEEAARSFVERTLIEEQNRILRLLHSAAQVIARQVDLTDLYQEMLRLMLDYSGADRAAFALATEGVLALKATAQSGQAPDVLEQGEAPDSARLLPLAWLEQAAHQRTVQATSDALREAALKDDPYVRQAQVRSAVALPLVNQGKLMGTVYLESRTETGLFTEDRLEVLAILGAQAAIAIDNAFVYENLEVQVANRTQQLLAANIQKDEMVRFVSHEIRSPLAGIMSLIELLEEPEIAANTDEVRRYGRLIRSSTSNVIKLANDILDLAKIESGTIVLTRKPVELRPFLEQLTAGFEPQLRTKGIDLQLSLEADVTLSADEPKLYSVVSNLLSNAIKFTPKGGEVSVTVQHPDASTVVLKVRDTGIGIKEDQLPRLFEKFGAKQRLGTEGERGTGLGLSIVRELVTLHGGTIGAESRVEKGSTFTVTLPLV